MKAFHSISNFLNTIGIKAFQQYENFFIFKIEDYFGEEKFKIEPYKHDFFELTFGSGHDVDIKIGNSSFKGIENCLSFTTPYQISSWNINSFQKNSLGYMILFKPEIFDASQRKFDLYRQFSFFNIYSSPLLMLSLEQRETIVGLMQTMCEEFNKDNKGRKEIIIGSYLTILLEKINNMYGSESTNKIFTNRAEEITFSFEKSLRKNVDYKNRLADYASELNISKTYLSEVVKKTTGKSAKSLIQEVIIYKAKSLLKQSDGTIETIAYELGFKDASNFVKYFKSHLGVTPNSFRNKH